jgi:hypothetical protein
LRVSVTMRPLLLSSSGEAEVSVEVAVAVDADMGNLLN